ncbi:hypothetical protein [Kribbella sp. CA-293567]|uniref:hypothetical protein n=1 Tax=Kribbella sp. CA-293567 TaxID=3002436 RepID=UPI0022DDAAAA|nr:hypothetical protein [Kribbella sp. CA-293567]WBQ04218.1 hypothetical protein OX958_30150 [Kribbella sp. CA-293567]
MTGSHRSSRGGGRAAAREARRQQSRRRNQIIGAGAAVLVLVGGGGIAAVNAFGGDDSAGDNARSGNQDDKSGGNGPGLLGDAKVLIDGTAAKQLAPAGGAWAVASTDNGSNAPDRSFVCQSQRFADPAGIRTWIRNFRNPSTKDTAVQYVEVSNDEAAAGKAYSTITGWLSACNTPQIRLISSYTTSGLGSKGVVAVFGQPGPKTNKYRTVSVSTAGQTTMVVEYDTVGKTPPKPDTLIATAGAGLKRICDEAKCTTGTPVAKPVLLPTTEPAGFMAPIDLPVLPSIDKPWVSTTSTTPKGTGCDKLDLKKAKARATRAQTYVVPEAKVPPEFGLDTMVAAFASPAAAGSFVGDLRKAVDNCKKTTSNATVRPTGEIAVGNSVKGESWRVSYDTGGGKIFTYRIGIAAAGSRAVYALYPVLEKLDITNEAFNEVLTRAAERSAAYK